MATTAAGKIVYFESKTLSKYILKYQKQVIVKNKSLSNKNKIQFLASRPLHE